MMKLGKHEKRILEKVRSNGFVTIWDVCEAVYERKVGFYGSFLVRSAREGGIKMIRNFSALYRTMRGLVKKKLVGRVLHVRPTIWIDIDKDGKPTLKGFNTCLKLFMLLGEGKLTVQVGDEIRVYKFRKEV